ncbi:MAG: hypothetical protein KIT09_28835 [Bryobacteraceae bacterium]|nr:hypothetical protein [Bryobacteraceae bacterium]
MLRRLFFVGMLACAVVFGGVHRIHFVERSDVLDGKSMGPAGPYERIVAKAYFEIDPKLEANRIISDIDLAPRNERGMVEFSSDIYVLKPTEPARSNGTILYEVSNRGGKGLLSMFCFGGGVDPRTEADFGDALLLEQGYTLVWIGWQFDTPVKNELVRLYPPVAKNKDGSSIEGLVRAEFVSDEKIFSHSLADRNHVAYPVLDPMDASIQMTVRENREAQRRVVPREQWQFARVENGKPVSDAASVYMKAGFEPGKLYEVVYKSKDPALVGLGPAAVRDFISFLKYKQPPDPTGPFGAKPIFVLSDMRQHMKRAIGFGTSQSGRFLRTFLYYGFNRDEEGRIVFDGVWSHVAGGGRGSFNHRFAQPSRDGHPHMNTFYPTDIYPFSDADQADAETGRNEGILTRARADKVVPKIFYTNSSYEYWGRAASLIHTTLDGKQDAAPADGTRIYLFSGTQHGPGRFPPAKNKTQHLANANDYRWAMRGLLVAFNRWLTDGVEPPASKYPLLSKGELVAPGALRFPKMAGVEVPTNIQRAYRVDYGPEFRSKGIVSIEPPKVGRPFVTLTPQVDADGNEIAGIRLPVVQAALGSFTGWNLRDPAIGAPQELFSMVGSYLPFARTKAEREKSGDPRPSVEERFAGREAYVAKLRSAAEDLAKSGYILDDDVWKIVETGSAQWDFVMGTQTAAGR